LCGHCVLCFQLPQPPGALLCPSVSLWPSRGEVRVLLSAHCSSYTRTRANALLCLRERCWGDCRTRVSSLASLSISLTSAARSASACHHAVTSGSCQPMQ
jgi:hypothetical protein